jgi:hypothetical protein
MESVLHLERPQEGRAVLEASGVLIPTSMGLPKLSLCYRWSR